MDLTAIAAALAGFVLLVIGGEVLVTGAKGISLRFGLRPATVGVTVVALATSAPELAVSVGATLSGDPGLTLGNVIGSNIANVLLVLGTAAVLAPVVLTREATRRDLPVSIAFTVVLILLAADGTVSKADGFVLIVMLAMHLGWAVWSTRSGKTPATTPPSDQKTTPTQAFGRIIAGTMSLVAGAELLVYGAGSLAQAWGVDEVVVGLAVVAIGTSLPELAAAVSAARRGEATLAVGNALGSNIANIGLVLGVPALLVAPIPVPFPAVRQDIFFAFLVSLCLWVVGVGRGRIGRVGGVAFALGYLIYIASLVMTDRP
ncbi:calcium/sodium antiporter [Kocuria rhizophila]|uniref:calcium/sodium antiporter n=1 Tax=Kocuria rhizophila TaxID=72000 RepID=UPI001DD065EC|nr:calcium/sodium antiporter [Kocuria rhizophila]MCC5670993.1 calcium/sodium antiporter [Kocuria rhizophila]